MGCTQYSIFKSDTLGLLEIVKGILHTFYTRSCDSFTNIKWCFELNANLLKRSYFASWVFAFIYCVT